MSLRGRGNAHFHRDQLQGEDSSATWWQRERVEDFTIVPIAL